MFRVYLDNSPNPSRINILLEDNWISSLIAISISTVFHFVDMWLNSILWSNILSFNFHFTNLRPIVDTTYLPCMQSEAEYRPVISIQILIEAF
jgi:hypothetical protein